MHGPSPDASTSGRCVIVVDGDLSAGRAANAAAVLAVTFGKRHPELVGDDLVDADGAVHHGLMPLGITVLAAPRDLLPRLRDRASEARIDVVCFPVEGQQTTDYQAFRRAVSVVSTSDLRFVALCLYGARKAVTKLVGNLPLLR